MLEIMELMPGITLRCFPDHRFKQGCIGIQLVRPMCREEAAMNTVIPAVLLRGTERYPDLRAITQHLDDLYGAAVGPMVRRVGDYQTTGLFCSFIEDRYALPGDRVLEPMAAFLEELMLHPRTVGDGFDPEIMAVEKDNLASAIDAQKNDRRLYAMGRMLRNMCRGDSFSVPRLGEKAAVEALDPVQTLTHYRKILEDSPVELSYIGSAPMARVAGLLRPIFAEIRRNPVPRQPQTPLHFAGEEQNIREIMDVSQARLCMGFTTPILNTGREFGAMQLMNAIFGAGMTSKLFMNVREKLSLCYGIGSAYYGSKGIVTVAAGIDPEKEQQTKEQILLQLEACRRGEITGQEMEAAREAVLSALRSVHDSPGAMEGYYVTAALSGMKMTPEEYARAVSDVTREQVAEAAASLTLRTTYILRGAEA